MSSTDRPTRPEVMWPVCHADWALYDVATADSYMDALETENQELREQYQQTDRTQDQLIEKLTAENRGLQSQVDYWNTQTQREEMGRKTDRTIAQTRITELEGALRECRKLAIALEKDTLEPDKVYILAGRIKAQGNLALSGEQTTPPEDT